MNALMDECIDGWMHWWMNVLMEVKGDGDGDQWGRLWMVLPYSGKSIGVQSFFCPDLKWGERSSEKQIRWISIILVITYNVIHGDVGHPWDVGHPIPILILLPRVFSAMDVTRRDLRSSTFCEYYIQNSINGLRISGLGGRLPSPLFLQCPLLSLVGDF